MLGRLRYQPLVVSPSCTKTQPNTTPVLAVWHIRQELIEEWVPLFRRSPHAPLGSLKQRASLPIESWDSLFFSEFQFAWQTVCGSRISSHQLSLRGVHSLGIHEAREVNFPCKTGYYADCPNRHFVDAVVCRKPAEAFLML